MLKISWDAGHGGFGVTPGKRAPDNSMYEWDFNNAVVKYAMEELSHYKDVAQLRVDDPSGKTDIPLKDRTNRVNAWGSNFHISMHGNASGNVWSSARGIETFVYKAEGKSYEVAKKIQAAIVKDTGLTDRGVKTADLHMIRETNMSAALVEGGFMTNKEELILMKSESYRKKVALAIVKGLVSAFGLVKVVPVKDGWKMESSKWYLYEKGTMVKDKWVKYKEKWFYLAKDGVMAASEWVKWEGKWYYVNAKGEMLVGWHSILHDGKHKLFYFHSDGSMAANTSVAVKLDGNGEIIHG